MRIALGSDHRGREAVETLREHLTTQGHDVVVLGPQSVDSCDYPDSAFEVAGAVVGGDADRGILVCGSGIGMSMAANKVPGVRAALTCDAQAAEMTRRHNDANVLCLSADRHDATGVVAVADVFLATDFEGGRHARRVEKITAIEKKTHGLEV